MLFSAAKTNVSRHHTFQAAARTPPPSDRALPSLRVGCRHAHQVVRQVTAGVFEGLLEQCRSTLALQEIALFTLRSCGNTFETSPGNSLYHCEGSTALSMTRDQ